MKASSRWTLYGIISLAKIRRMYSQLLIRYKPQNIQIYSKNSNLPRNKSFQIYVSIHRPFPFRSFSFSALWSFHWYFYWSQSSNCFLSATDCRLSIRVSLWLPAIGVMCSHIQVEAENTQACEGEDICSNWDSCLCLFFTYIWKYISGPFQEREKWKRKWRKRKPKHCQRHKPNTAFGTTL